MTAIQLDGVISDLLQGTADAGITITARIGQVLGVVASSDAVATTILRLMAGEVTPERGSVQGVPAPEDQIWIPRGNDLSMTLSALENVAVPLVATGTEGRDAVNAAEVALSEVGLGDSLNHLVEELSGGQQQRVAVARAIVQRGTFLFADEPTSALDARNRRRVLSILCALADRGLGVVITASDQYALEDIADQLLVVE